MVNQGITPWVNTTKQGFHTPNKGLLNPCSKTTDHQWQPEQTHQILPVF